MRKQMMILCAALILAGCAGRTAQTVPEDPVSDEPVSETVPEPVQDTKEENEVLHQYQEEMEAYEDLEVVFLGTITEDRTLDDILQRGACEKDISEVIAAIPESRIIYGDRGEYSDYVILVIPGKGVDLKAGRYNWYAGEITDVWIDETDAMPFIYVENGDSIDPVGQIEYVRRVNDGSYDGFMYTGLDAVRSHLRTDYHMGIVDLSAYKTFDSEEVPFYSQNFFDTLQTYDEVRDALNSGGTLNAMEEMIRDGHAYAVYDLDKGDTRVLYGITIDPISRERSVIASYDSGETWETAGQG